MHSSAGPIVAIICLAVAWFGGFVVGRISAPQMPTEIAAADSGSGEIQLDPQPGERVSYEEMRRKDGEEAISNLNFKASVLDDVAGYARASEKLESFKYLLEAMRAGVEIEKIKVSQRTGARDPDPRTPPHIELWIRERDAKKQAAAEAEENPGRSAELSGAALP